MTTARPDTSRRREPSCPGRRFGISALGTARFVLIALFASAASAAMAEEPILLSNKDVVRLHAAQAADGAGASQTAAPGDDPARTARAEAQIREQLDRIERESMDRVSRALDARVVDSAADALPVSAPPPVGAGVRSAPAAPAAPDSDDASDTDGEPIADLFQPPRATPEPACIYGPSGHLLFAPEGRRCASVRYGAPANSIQGVGSRSKATPSSSHRDGESTVGCVYGSRGQLLYASRGVTCSAR